MASVRGKVGADLVAAQRANLENIMFADPATVTPLALRIQSQCTAMARLRVERVDWGPGLIASIPGYRGKLAAVWGDRDAFVQPSEVPGRPAKFRTMNPAAQTHILTGVGHWMQFEDAPGFNAILRDLIRQ